MKYKEEPLESFIDVYLKNEHLMLAREQREFVWDSRNVIQLLDSICRGIPMGVFILGEGRGKDQKTSNISEGKDIIYDGQQRMLSLRKVFVENEFVLPKDKFLGRKECKIWIDIESFSNAIDLDGEDLISSFMIDGRDLVPDKFCDELKKNRASDQIILAKLRMRSSDLKGLTVKDLKKALDKILGMESFYDEVAGQVDASKLSNYFRKTLEREVLLKKTATVSDRAKKRMNRELLQLIYPHGIKKNQSKNEFLLRFKHQGAVAGCYPFEVVPNEVGSRGGEAIRKYILPRRTFGNSSASWMPMERVLRSEASDDEDIGKIRDFIRSRLDKYKICICRIGKEVGSNIFLRINRAGQPVSDEEQYFAALQQRWESAQQGLKGLYGDEIPLGLLDAVRLVVHIAHNIETDGDTYSKKKDGAAYLRLQLREFEKGIAEKIEGLLKCEQTKACMIDTIRQYVQRVSAAGLGFGVHEINKKMLSIAMASAIAELLFNKIGLPRGRDRKWQQLARYLFVADQSGLLSGAKKDKEIRKVFNALWKSSFPEQTEGEKDFNGKCEQNKINGLLWLSIFQKLSFEIKRGSFDIDHIVPSAWVKNRKGASIHRVQQVIKLMGNMWAVDSSKNREWKDEASPTDKFIHAKKHPGVFWGDDFDKLKILESQFDGVNKGNIKDKAVAGSVASATEMRTDAIKSEVLKILGLK